MSLTNSQSAGSNRFESTAHRHHLFLLGWLALLATARRKTWAKNAVHLTSFGDSATQRSPRSTTDLASRQDSSPHRLPPNRTSLPHLFLLGWLALLATARRKTWAKNAVHLTSFGDSATQRSPRSTTDLASRQDSSPHRLPPNRTSHRTSPAHQSCTVGRVCPDRRGAARFRPRTDRPTAPDRRYRS